MYQQKTILFIDEIHRFHKGQQDYLLPFVEDGTVILIGATTENPYFEVNRALISRSTVFELKPLSLEEIEVLIRRAVYDEEKKEWEAITPRSKRMPFSFWLIWREETQDLL